jgi:Domain of unknown function (DUF2024)
MKVAVFDTYVSKKEGGLMHFDILVEDAQKHDKERVFAFGKEYLASKGQSGQRISTDECQFCHIEVAPTNVVEAIGERGYFVVEMQGCK